MDFPVLVAKVLSVYLIISGIFLVMRQRTLTMMLKDFFSHPATVYLAGTILTFFGLVMLFRHNVWDGTWRVWVSVFSVLVLAKGLIYIFAPQSLANLHLERSKPLVVFFGILAIAAGVYLFSIS